MDVRIRPWRLTDAEPLAKIINNKNVQDNLRDGIPFPYTLSDARDYISLALGAKEPYDFFWAIEAGGVLAGSIGIFRKENIHRLTAELGYYVAEEHWGKGIATAAVKAASEFVFGNTDIVRIFAEPFAKNAGSCRVLEKAGFAFEGTLKNNAVKNGVVIDMRLYALVRGSAPVSPLKGI